MGAATELCVDIRPLKAGDEALLAAAHAYTSRRSYNQRFHGGKGAFSRAELHRLCNVDGYSRVAFAATDHTRGGRLAAVARYVRCGGDEAEIAILVHDPYQRQGLGQRMLQLLVEHARSSGIRRLLAVVQPDNEAMVALLRSVCPDAHIAERDENVTYVVELGSPA